MAPPNSSVVSGRTVYEVDAMFGGDQRRKSHDDLTSAPPSGNTGLPAVAAAPTAAGPIAESSEKSPAAEPATVSVLTESNTDVPESSDDDDQTPPSDGSTRAWLMILGTWCCSFCSYGWINSEFAPCPCIPSPLSCQGPPSSILKGQ